MAFLVWPNDKEDDADESLANIDAMYGCPYVADNDYRMDTWDVVKESNATPPKYGFYKPEERLGKTMGELMGEVVGDPEEFDVMPEEFEPEEEE